MRGREMRALAKKWVLIPTAILVLFVSLFQPTSLRAGWPNGAQLADLLASGAEACVSRLRHLLSLGDDGVDIELETTADGYPFRAIHGQRYKALGFIPGQHGGRRILYEYNWVKTSSLLSSTTPERGPRQVVRSMGLEVSRFFGFELMDTDRITFPDYLELKGAIEKWNGGLSAGHPARIWGEYYPVEEETTDKDYLGQLASGLKIPMGQTGVHRTHDYSFHFIPIQLAPEAWIEAALLRIKAIHAYVDQLDDSQPELAEWGRVLRAIAANHFDVASGNFGAVIGELEALGLDSFVGGQLYLVEPVSTRVLDVAEFFLGWSSPTSFTTVVAAQTLLDSGRIGEYFSAPREQVQGLITDLEAFLRTHQERMPEYLGLPSKTEQALALLEVVEKSRLDRRQAFRQRLRELKRGER